MAKTDPANKLERAIGGYDRGIYTLAEAGAQILECFTAQNVAEVYSTLPERFQAFLKSEIESAPVSDEEWKNAEYFYIGSGCAISGYEPPLETPEEQHAERHEWKINHRSRIEAMREFLRINGG